MSNQDIDPRVQTVYDKIAKETYRIMRQARPLNHNPEVAFLPSGMECSARLGRVEFGGEK